MNRLQSVAAFVIFSGLTAWAGAQSTTQTQPAQTQPAADALPRYHLETGQESVYESTLTGLAENGTPNFRRDTRRTLWVTRRNGDGSWRVVMAETSRSVRMQGDKAVARPRDGKELLQFDLYPDGRIAGKALQSPQLNLTVLFPVLPPTTGARAAWDSPPTSRGVWHYKAVASSQPAEWTFLASEDSPMNKVYEVRQQVTYVFDLGRGVLARSQASSEQRSGGGSGNTETSQLVSQQQRDKAWIEDFDRQADVLFAAQDAYDGAFRDARADDPKVADKLTAAAAPLREALSKLKDPLLVDPIQARLGQHASSVKGMLEQLQEQAKQVNKPAGDWTTTDFAGRTHSLQDYRGKVVVMDFWFRGCGWCILAMPQIKQLAEDFAGKPVAILGMNIDSQETDATFVIDTLHLNYPNLRAADIAKRYEIQGFPTLLVLDGQGVIRNVHAGFEPDLRQKIAAEIGSLLAEPRSSATRPAATRPTR